MGTPADSPLGKAAHYGDAYDAGLLYPVERASQRAQLGIGATLPFRGMDVWTAWEVSWLDRDGRPEIAIGTFDVPCGSPCIVESKSAKLYLTALNNTRYPDRDTLAATIARDLQRATGAEVAVTLSPPESFAAFARHEPAGQCLDAMPLRTIPPVPDAALLRAAGAVVDETLFTRLFRSVCPVTGQPDYACVSISYEGNAIDRSGLLAYLLAFRRHPGFHEHCVERIFVDILRACAPAALTVEAHFTRRGGIDINPLRTTHDRVPARSAPTPQQ